MLRVWASLERLRSHRDGTAQLTRALRTLAMCGGGRGACAQSRGICTLRSAGVERLGADDAPLALSRFLAPEALASLPAGASPPDVLPPFLPPAEPLPAELLPLFLPLLAPFGSDLPKGVFVAPRSAFPSASPPSPPLRPLPALPSRPPDPPVDSFRFLGGTLALPPPSVGCAA